MLFILLLTMGMFGFTFWLARQTLARDAGPKEMTLVATAIREGAEGFLSTQYSSIARYVIVMAGMLFCLYLTRPPPHPTISTFTMACLMSSTFCAGAFMSGLAGYIGMWISVRANVRTAAAATRSYQESIDTALRGGAVCGLLVVGLCVFGLTTLFMLFRTMFPDTPSAFTPNLLVGFGFGASLVALFAQVGGGIYTKAADVGADLVGKVEVGIPEDDPRNPAVIADLVGDNVGDCAGRGADLFESISAEIIGATLHPTPHTPPSASSSPPTASCTRTPTQTRGGSSPAAASSGCSTLSSSCSSRSTIPTTLSRPSDASPPRRPPDTAPTSLRASRSDSSPHAERQSPSEPPSWPPITSGVARCPGEASSALRWRRWVCSPPPCTYSPWTPSAPSPTMPAASSR